jgi:hypothetical protein
MEDMAAAAAADMEMLQFIPAEEMEAFGEEARLQELEIFHLIQEWQVKVDSEEVEREEALGLTLSNPF